MDISVIPFAFPGLDNVRCAFQTREKGDGNGPFAAGNISFQVGDEPRNVLANRKALQRRLEFDTWQELNQVHGTELVFNGEPGYLEAPIRPDLTQPVEADGQATSEPGRALVIKTADCQPLLFAHKSGKYIAALHVGWRGLRASFPLTGVQRFCETYSIDPIEVMAVRGPSLGPGASEFVNFDDEWGDEFLDYYEPTTKTVDLWRLTRDQLLQAGLRLRNIYNLDLCTYTINDVFFSYRRDKECGRLANIIWIAG